MAHIEELRSKFALGNDEAHLIDECQIGTTEELLGLVVAFPSIGVNRNIDMAKLRELAQKQSDPRFVSLLNSLGKAESKKVGGAWFPSQEIFNSQLDSSDVELRADNLVAPGHLLSSTDLDKPLGRLDGTSICLHMQDWPVRDQGSQRDTCTAFAVCACVEFALRREPEERPRDLSEQFLFWAAKKCSTDPFPNRDGSYLAYVAQGLQYAGICDEAECTYNPGPMPNNPSQETSAMPSALARTSAIDNCKLPSVLRAISNRASDVLALLSNGRPVAVTMATWIDPVSKHNVWLSPTAVAYGEVSDPPAGAVAASGHAVCIVGFVPDMTEKSGGYFVFRNSWGMTRFGRAPRVPSIPEPGYGRISATHLGRALWEVFQL